MDAGGSKLNFAISTRRQPSSQSLGFQSTATRNYTQCARSCKRRTPDDRRTRAPCCYAQSDKYWVTDPTGIAWETFHTLGSIPVYGEDTAVFNHGASTAPVHRRSDAACPRSRSQGELLLDERTALPRAVLCTGNSARSIIAESLLNQSGKGRSVRSARAAIEGRRASLALELLSQEGLPITSLRSKSWDEYAAPGAPPIDFIFTVCDNAAGEACPCGRETTAHWGIPDPAAVEGSERERRQASAARSTRSPPGSSVLSLFQ